MKNFTDDSVHTDNLTENSTITNHSTEDGMIYDIICGIIKFALKHLISEEIQTETRELFSLSNLSNSITLSLLIVAAFVLGIICERVNMFRNICDGISRNTNNQINNRSILTETTTDTADATPLVSQKSTV